MIKRNSVLCIIPARSGSQGIKDKNLKKLNNLPLVKYPLDAAKKSKYIDRIIVSTDSQEIINIVNKEKIYAPFKRPKKHALNHSPSSDVIIHTFEWLRNGDSKFYDYLVFLEPTSPLTSASDIDKALELLTKNKSSKCIVSVCEAIKEHSTFNYKLNKNNQLIIKKRNKSLRRQELDKEYFLDGSFYISESNFFLSKKNFFTSKTMAFVNKKIKSFELDDEIDFLCLSTILRSNLLKDNEK